MSKVLEILYCNKWTRTEGLAALIITPTRELAYQIFETLRKIGVHHDFSAGLIIGECCDLLCVRFKLTYFFKHTLIMCTLLYFRRKRFEV